MRNLLYLKYNLCDQPPINMVLNRSLGFHSQELFHPAAREPNYILGRLSFSARPAQHRTPDRAALAWVTGGAARETTSEACSSSSSKAGENNCCFRPAWASKKLFQKQCYNYCHQRFR